MRQSQLFGKTRKKISAEIKLASHRFLVQAGFIEESVAGRYYFLPLGMRVMDKIIRLVEQEMNAAGAQKMVTPILHPLALWKETNRTNTAGFELMKVQDRRGSEFALGGTAEEMMVDLVRKSRLSYKDLPFNIYQFSQKFRDELRVRGGLLRAREFVMKDAYSFHIDEEDFKREYQVMWKTYERIFKKVGLRVIPVEADNGYIGGEYCHEFVVESEVGESKFYLEEGVKVGMHEDILNRKNTEEQKDMKRTAVEKRGIEVGNIFQLGYHYSHLMKGALFVDGDGKEKPFYMGCYGIGIGRTLAAVVEEYHDEAGMIWPESIAPFAFHLIELSSDDAAVKKEAEALYDYLTARGAEVLYDDRDDRKAGEKFADADLIGIPYRLVISDRTLKSKKYELKKRGEKKERLIEKGELEALLH